jgi:hypothetical protein
MANLPELLQQANTSGHMKDFELLRAIPWHSFYRDTDWYRMRRLTAAPIDTEIRMPFLVRVAE